VVREHAVLPFQLEAWLPEQIAIMKLRGFVHDAGGEVVESLPGLVRVRLGGRGGATGPLAWFGIRKAGSHLDVELHIRHADPTQPSRITVDVLFRPTHPTQLADAGWQQRCNGVFVELRSYLMGRS
jgi:eukaryotic-like serine/threonine-protein kinase